MAFGVCVLEIITSSVARKYHVKNLAKKIWALIESKQINLWL